MTYIQRYSEMLVAKTRPYQIVNGQLFSRQRDWIVPHGPAAQAFTVTPVQCRQLLKSLGGVWVMWTEGFSNPSLQVEWYAVICRKHVTIEENKSREARRKIRKGLLNCEVRQVDPEEIARQGYSTYYAANIGYGRNGADIPTEEAFQRSVIGDKPFGDVRHQWAAYAKGRMVAFSQNLVYDKTEVTYSLMKYHPDYLELFPAYALIYRMNEYYLEQQGFGYVNDGFRSILHETNIQEFLIKNFGFEKAYTNLHIHYHPPLDLMLQLARPFRKILSKANPKLAALLELDRLRCKRTFE
jgi:hypothetical protein